MEPAERMAPHVLRALRMHQQLLLTPGGLIPKTAHHLLAVQAQDLPAGCYALAQRTGAEVTRGDLNDSLERGEIVRSWTLRGTLHLCAAGDLGWLVRLSRPRMLRAMRRRLEQLCIGAAEIDRAAGLVTEHLSEHDRAGRGDLFALLQAHGIATGQQRGVHLLVLLALDGLICQGPVPPGASVTGQDFVLVDSWVERHHVPRDPLAELFVRYLCGHGPASVRDAAWYTGQTLTELNRVAAQLGERVRVLGCDARGERLYVPAGSEAELMLEEGRLPSRLPLRLLGPFDEYYLSYADRGLVAEQAEQLAIAPGKNGMFLAFWLRNGRAEAIWRRDAVPPGTDYARLHARYLSFRG